jgi:hypothetical protein
VFVLVEIIPTGYQKISYHMVFDVKYDIGNKENLLVGGNWNINQKEDIASIFLYGKVMEKVYIASGLEFIEDL